MKKMITRERIVETALELMRNKKDLRGLNLREIARALGCAHTNLYNYFASYNDLLWETHAALLEIFIKIIKEKLQAANNAELRLHYFFQTFVDFYMDNKGWFRLAWHENISGERPQRNVDAVQTANKALNACILEVWKEIYGEYPNAEQTKRVLHNTHCYIVGEVSNHLLGRGLIENETELKAYIAYEAARMFRLCLLKE